jgi:hypothetical protein
MEVSEEFYDMTPEDYAWMTKNSSRGKKVLF